MIVTQALLGAIVMVGVATLAYLPGFSSAVAVSLPEYAELRTPLLVFTMAFTILALVVVATVIVLVHRIHRGTILKPASLLWVNTIIASLLIAAAIIVIGFVVIGSGQAGSPFLALALTMVFLTLIVLACIVLVLRSLLRQSILISGELAEVV